MNSGLLEGEPISRWTRFWHEPVRAERLAAARILYAFALLTDQLVQYAPNLAYFFGPEGVAPAGINDPWLASRWKWTILFFNTDDMTVVTAAFAGWVAAAVALLVGWHARTAAFLAWFGALCFITRNPNLKNGGDDILQIGLFLLMISPCGAALSLDRRRKIRKNPALSAQNAEPVIAPWPVRLFQLQLCVLYVATGLAKTPGDTWWAGTSVHYAIVDVTMSRWSFAAFPLPLWVTAPMTWASLAFELTFPLLVVWKRTRPYALWFGVLFHIGIFLMIEVGWFSFYTLAMYGPWIPDSWWKHYFGPARARSGRDDVPETIAPGPHDYLVFYDTLCPICRRSRRLLERLDWGGRIVFRDIHDREQMAKEAPGVPYARALREIIVVTPQGKWLKRKTLGGFNALRRVAWTLPALWPALPLLYVPGVPTIARFVYRWVARNRYRLVNCNDGTCELHLRALAKANLDENEITQIVARARQSQTAATPEV